MANKTVKIHKAQPNVNIPVQSTVIEIDTEIKHYYQVGVFDNVCGQEAMELERALYASLPQGTYDRLLAMMMLRKSSHLGISYPMPKEN
jgi:hypothetical protein